MKFLGFHIGRSSNEEKSVIGYEITVCECDLDDRPFEGVPSGEDVRERGAPSIFGDYSKYPGGYNQAVKDWRNGHYTPPGMEEAVKEQEDESIGEKL